MPNCGKTWNPIRRKSEVVARVAEDFYYHAKYYQQHPPTLANLSRRLGITAQGLRSFLVHARIPGLRRADRYPKAKPSATCLLHLHSGRNCCQGVFLGVC